MQTSPTQDANLPPVVRAEALLGCLDAGQALGVKLGPLLARHGIQLSQLTRPTGFIEKPRLARFLQDVADYNACPYFGFFAGVYQPPLSFGPLTELLTRAPTLGAALDNVARFTHFYTEGVRYDVSVGRRSASFRRHNSYHYDLQPTQLDLLGMVQAFKMFQGVCGSDWAPTKVFLDQPAYPGKEALIEYFRCPVIFEASCLKIEFPREDLARRSTTGDPELLAAIEAWFTPEASEQGNEVANWVKKYIRVTMGSATCNVEHCAARLNIHPRNLQRELAASGYTFKQLLLEMRIRLAQEYLRFSSVPLSHIAGMLGYANASAFSRAFTHHSGLPPLKWRRNMQGNQH